MDHHVRGKFIDTNIDFNQKKQENRDRGQGGPRRAAIKPKSSAGHISNVRLIVIFRVKTMPLISPGCYVHNGPREHQLQQSLR